MTLPAYGKVVDVAKKVFAKYASETAMNTTEELT